MLQNNEIVLIRQFCLDRAITILASGKEAVTLERHLGVAEEIERFLIRVVDTEESQLGRD